MHHVYGYWNHVCRYRCGIFTEASLFFAEDRQTYSYTIFALLFLLGTSVGSNPQIVNNLSTLGLQALLIAIATTLGSVCMAKLIYHFFFEKKGGEK